MRTLDAVFAELGGAVGTDWGIYTTLAPLYRVMYVARGRIEGQQTVVEQTAPPDAATVLELGCGTGHLLAALESNSTFKTVIGADTSPTMVRIARKRAPCVCQADATAFTRNSMDLVVLLGAVLGHIRPDSTAQATIEQLGCILRPNGRVVCSVHRQLEDTRSRELTRHADGYKITQRDGQCPTKDDTFGWSVTVTMTHNITGETRRTTTTTTLRAFTPRS